jgi:hypothetical protein
MVTYQVGKCLATMRREHVMHHPDARLQIHYETNSHTCSWPEPYEVRDVGVLHVWIHDFKHASMGMHPSGNVWCHVGHQCGKC